MNGTQDWNGRLEICLGGHWGAVCEDQFEDVDAEVACRNLGFPSESEYIDSRVLAQVLETFYEHVYSLGILQMHLHFLEGHLERVRGCGFEGWSALEWNRISPTVSHPVQGISAVVSHTTPLPSCVQV